MERQVSVATPLLGGAERENVSDVLDSGRFLQGDLVEEFERKWAAEVGVEHAVAVNSGTAALALALRAVGLEPGEEVIVPSLTFGSTATAVVHQGGVPVFADVTARTHTLDYTDLERCVSDQTRAVIPVHLYGHPAEMDEIRAFADDHDLAVVEDAAQAHGARYRGEPVGSIGDVGCFSFYATKNVTTGEGGILTTDDADIAEQARLLRNHGMVDRDHHVDLGYNYRMGELNAAIGVAQVDRLGAFNRRRREISHRLFDALEAVPWLDPLRPRDHVDHAYFWAPFEIDTDAIGMSGKSVWRELGDRGVEVRHRYTTPLYDQPVFAERRGFNSTFPWSANPNDVSYDLHLETAERVAGNAIGLPNHPGLDDADIEYVVDVVSELEADT